MLHRNPLALLLAAFTLALCIFSTANAAPYRVAVVRDRIAGQDLATADTLLAALRKAGFATTPIPAEALADPARCSTRQFDCLLLPQSPFFPGAACENLRAFLRAGGDLALLGGHAFSQPVCRIGDEWLTQPQYEERLRAIPTEHLLYPFEDGDFSSWKRSTNKPEHPSCLVSDNGKMGRALRMELKDLGQWQWDTFAAPLPNGFPSGDNAVCFWARGDARTHETVLELNEADGSRWIARVKLQPQWQHCVLPASSFQFFADNSPRSRGGAADQVNLAQVRRLSFGLASGLTTHDDGDHTIWLDELGSSKAPAYPARDFSRRVELNLFEEYEPYSLPTITRAVAVPGQDVLARATSLPAKSAGESAIGFAFVGKSRFIPLLAAQDGYGRNRGWAGSLLINYNGPYKGSQWLSFGIIDPDFYRQPGFAAVLAQVLRRMQGKALVARAAADNAARQMTLPLTAPAPKGFVRLSPDRKQFLTPDGKPLFLTGCNYLGPSEYFCRFGSGQFDARLLEADFRRARAAGINAFRIWVAAKDRDPAVRAALSQCARKYGIYLIIHLAEYAPTGEEITRRCREVASWWKDEPMVLGYDLANEPYVSNVAALRYNGQPGPLLQLRPAERFAAQLDTTAIDRWVKERSDWSHLPQWVSPEDAREVYAAEELYQRYANRFNADGADYSTATGTHGTLPMDEPFAAALNEAFARWIDACTTGIRAADPNHWITVGYNTVLGFLPANAKLDFVSHHVYQRPTSCTEVMKNITTLDRLAQAYPAQPITLGEFGYTNGNIINGNYLDCDTSAVGEMMHYLYALAHGYSGCMKWMLADLPVAIMQDSVPWITGGRMPYEERFGFYVHDGTVTGQPKPIVPALRFLRAYIDSEGTGGTLTVEPGKTAIGAVYLFRGKNALFIGDRERNLPGLSFRAIAPANVMLRWQPGQLTILSTADTRLRLDPAAFVPGITAVKATLTGKRGSIRRSGKWLEIMLLAGETVTLRGK